MWQSGLYKTVAILSPIVFKLHASSDYYNSSTQQLHYS